MKSLDFACGIALAIIIVVNLLMFDLLLCADKAGYLLVVTMPMSMFAVRRMYESYHQAKREYW